MKTILVTGATGNLGVDVVRTLLDKGCRVCATVGSTGAPGSFADWGVQARQVNLTDETATRHHVEELASQHPDLSAAVLLVGGFAAGGIRETDGAALDKMLNLNFKTSYFVVRPLLEHFEKTGGGQVILVGTRAAIEPESAKDFAAYALAKSLLFRLAEIINAAGKGKGITAAVLVPSIIDTPANREGMPDANFAKWVKPADIAETIAFLLCGAGMALREGVLKLYNEA